jgi:O-antigen/teichoic acid export membrane protein
MISGSSDPERFDIDQSTDLAKSVPQMSISAGSPDRTLRPGRLVSRRQLDSSDGSREVTLLRSIMVLVSGRTSIAALNFLRNILLARLVSVEDYGIASTFIVAIAFVELMGDLGLDKLIVRHQHGNDARFVSVIQTIMVIRGGVLAGLMFLLAGTFAEVFNHPHLTWAYQIFALSPMIRSFVNLDVMRQQRQMAFGAIIKAEFMGALASVAVLWPLALILGDFRVMLVALIVEQVMRSIGTMWLAHRPMRFGWDSAIMKGALAFGTPLILNGVVLLLTQQGERILVGNQFTARDLGFFSAALTLAMTPSLILSKISQSFFSPILAKTQNEPSKFDAQSAVTLQVMLCISALVALSFTYIGPWVFGLAFGQKMAEGAVYVIPLGIAFAIRLNRAGSASTISITKGYTLNPLITSLVRIVALPIAFLIAMNGGSILDVAIVAIAGELVSSAVGLILLRTQLHLKAPGRMLLCYSLGVALIASCVARFMWDFEPLVADIVPLALFVLLLLSCFSLRRLALNWCRARFGKIKSTGR